MEPAPQFASSDYKPSNKLRLEVVVDEDGGGDLAVESLMGPRWWWFYEDETPGGGGGRRRRRRFHEASAMGKGGLSDWWRLWDWTSCVPLLCSRGCNRGLHVCEASRGQVVDEVVNAFGRIDILINNAAEQYKSSLVEEIDEERLERVFRTNIFSYFFTVRAGQPIEVAPSYVFLACNHCSSYITGQVLHPNGGTIVNA
uniref:Uncharacterized protein n=1 Tax=Fagus sylvatica TaxID=28930 RepID=A0A2N9EUX7_FAGSY